MSVRYQFYINELYEQFINANQVIFKTTISLILFSFFFKRSLVEVYTTSEYCVRLLQPIHKTFKHIKNLHNKFRKEEKSFWIWILPEILHLIDVLVSFIIVVVNFSSAMRNVSKGGVPTAENDLFSSSAECDHA